MKTLTVYMMIQMLGAGGGITFIPVNGGEDFRADTHHCAKAAEATANDLGLANIDAIVACTASDQSVADSLSLSTNMMVIFKTVTEE